MCQHWVWRMCPVILTWSLLHATMESGSRSDIGESCWPEEFSTSKWDQIWPLWCRKGRGQSWVWAPILSFIRSRPLLLWFTADHSRLAGLWAFRVSLSSLPTPLWENVIRTPATVFGFLRFLGIWTPAIRFASQSLYSLGYLLGSQKCPYSMFLLYCLALYRTLGQP